MAHTFNHSTQEAEAEAGRSELEAREDYIVSSRKARATQRDLVLKNEAKQNRTKIRRKKLMKVLTLKKKLLISHGFRS